MSLVRLYPHSPLPLQADLFGPLVLAKRTRLLLLLAGFFCLALGAFLFSLLRVAPAAAAAHGQVATTKPARPMELHIADNGLVLLRSARIASIEGSTITLSTAWGSTNFTWVVHTNASSYGTREFGTKFLTREGQKIALSNLQIGELVTITGTLADGAQSPTVEAQTVRLSQ